MKAISSDNQLHAVINRNFVIKVSEIIGEYWWPVDDEMTEFELRAVYSDSKLTTAKKLSQFIDEDMKQKLFEKALNGKNQHYLFKIRKRVQIRFHRK